MEPSRDDFIIAIRSAFLKKGTKQRFSLVALLIFSISIIILEKFIVTLKNFYDFKKTWSIPPKLKVFFSINR